MRNCPVHIFSCVSKGSFIPIVAAQEIVDVYPACDVGIDCQAVADEAGFEARVLVDGEAALVGEHTVLADEIVENADGFFICGHAQEIDLVWPAAFDEGGVEVDDDRVGEGAGFAAAVPGGLVQGDHFGEPVGGVLSGGCAIDAQGLAVEAHGAADLGAGIGAERVEIGGVEGA